MHHASSTLRILGFILLAYWAAATPLLAELRLGAPFTDGMVVQREREVRIWGWDAPGQIVQLQLGESLAEAETDQTGRWEVILPPPEKGKSLTLKAAGSSTIERKDWIAGEVWLALGQSNMEWALKDSTGGIEAVQTIGPRDIRFFVAPKAVSKTPLNDLDARWRQLDAQTAPDVSGVAFFFARNLTDELQVPVGIIQVAWGGANIVAFMTEESLRRQGSFDRLLEEHVAGAARWQEALAKWVAGGRQGRQPGSGGAGEQHYPGHIENAMVHPFKPLSVRGVLWYQGENNTSTPDSYPEWFRLLVASWREGFRAPDLPIYFVQLHSVPGDNRRWAAFRPMQEALSRSDENVEMVVMIDTGTPGVHPPEKQPVGERLARIALARDYGRAIVPGSPRLVAATWEEEALVLTFDRVGDGLKLHESDDDRVFQWQVGDTIQPAKVRLDGPNRLVATYPDDTPRPSAFLHNVVGNPTALLFNSIGLPAAALHVTASGSEPR